MKTYDAYVLAQDAEDGTRVLIFEPAMNSGVTAPVVRAANLIIEAMEAVCYAERELSEKTLNEAREQERKSLDEQIRTEERREASKKALTAKNEPFRKAEDFVRSEWRKYKSEYQENKSAFARDYVRIVANKFTGTKGEPLKITEKQMKDAWLSDNPRTRKPDGERVGR